MTDGQEKMTYIGPFADRSDNDLPANGPMRRKHIKASSVGDAHPAENVSAMENDLYDMMRKHEGLMEIESGSPPPALSPDRHGLSASDAGNPPGRAVCAAQRQKIYSPCAQPPAGNIPKIPLTG